jgi:hypothetical protein
MRCALSAKLNGPCANLTGNLLLVALEEDAAREVALLKSDL